jgi:hypothetical protein
VPTPDNVTEVVELIHQLGLLTRTKNTWTAAGQLVAGMRAKYADTLKITDNPFVLGFESVALLRQVLEVDGLLMRHLVEYLVRYEGQRIRRDAIALDLPSIATKALDDARKLRRPSHEIATAKSFVELLKSTGAKRGTQSSAPGVLEHRTAPRLEWLTDFGVLSKVDLPKNGFEYSLTSDAPLLSRELSKPIESENWAADTSLAYWRTSVFHRASRAAIGQMDVEASILGGYRIMQRTVGPASIRDVAFAASALCSDSGISFGNMIDHIVSWSTNTDGVTVSGGRFSRGPELVHVTPRLLAE